MPDNSQAIDTPLAAELARWRARVLSCPQRFRESLRLSPDDARLLARTITPWQARDFTALDDGWRAVVGLTKPPFSACRRAWIERPRGHSKTSDMAIQIAWALLAARRPLRGICAAADCDQARLILDAVRRLVDANPGLRGLLQIGTQSISTRKGYARLNIISSDVGSSFGITPDFIICDELSHWPGDGLWHSLLSSAAKKPYCLLAVLTNAGVGRGWQWQAREAARTHPDWHFSSLQGSQAPWISPADLEEQRAILPPSVFDRLWNNQWQATEGNYLTPEEVALCRDIHIATATQGRSGVHYIAAIDYAEKHDRTAAILLHREGHALVVDRLDVIAPTPNKPVEIAWVEDWIARTAKQFGRVTFVVDEHQLLGTIQRMTQGHAFVRFPFAGGRGNHDLALLLRRFVIHRQIRWYPNCGALPNDPQDNLEMELASLMLKQSPGGRIRFESPTPGFDDRAFVLAAAIWWANQQTESRPRWHLSPTTFFE